MGWLVGGVFFLFCGVGLLWWGCFVVGVWCSVGIGAVAGGAGVLRPWEVLLMCVPVVVEGIPGLSAPVGWVVFDPAGAGGGNTAVRGAFSVVRRWLPSFARVGGWWGGDGCVLRSVVDGGVPGESASVTVACRWDGRVFRWGVVAVHRGFEARRAGSGDWHAMLRAVFGVVDEAVVSYLSSPLDVDCGECRAAGWV